MRPALLVTALLLILAAPASAATVSVNGTTLVYDAAPGEANAPQGTAGADDRVNLNDGVTLTPGPGCQQFGSPTGVFCDVPGMTALVFHLGDGTDRIGISGRSGAQLVVDGGPGDDDLNGDRVDGGSGNDTLRGDSGVQSFNGGPGRDQLLGQGGRDRLSGGSGDDSIQGQGRLSGGSGRDDIDTRPNGVSRKITSRLFGGSGSDIFHTGNHAKDIVDCGKGKDFVSTGRVDGGSDRKRDRFKRSCERRYISR
jgi:Ca2+-binding RTX toxin-like protein